MNDNPGILPLKLGNAQNKIDTWKFIQVFDITNLIQQFNEIQNQYFRIKIAFENNTNVSKTYKYNFYNSYNLANLLQTKINIQIKQINPLYGANNNRYKRGLIDGLGSIIKSITGNLDQYDAEKYNKAIENLSDNQLKIKTIIKNQISMFDKSIENFQNNIKNLSNNQIIIKHRIDMLETILYNTEAYFLDTYQYLLLQITLSQIINEYQIIYDILEKIETAISFAKINVFHNSIVQSDELFKEINSVSQYLKNSKLPFKPELINLILFEKTINIKSYSDANKIIFILEIPIVENDSYNLYHLYPFPVKNNNSLNVIIPNAKYLIFNEQNYAFLDNKCEEVTPSEFICKDSNIVKISQNNPCEIELLKYNKFISNCHLTPVEILENKVQKIEQNKWIVICPKQTIAIQYCQSNSENIPLLGSYIIELNSDCEIKINDVMIKNLGDTKFNYKNIQLPKLNFTKMSEKSINKLKPLNLDSIDLNNIHPIRNIIENDLESIKPFIFETSINIWVIIMYVLFIFVLIYILYKCQIFNKFKRRILEEKEEIPLQENPAPNPRIFHL